MAIENGKNTNVGSRISPLTAKKVRVMLVMLRLAAMAATVAAALVMGLNKQSTRTAVAIVGTATIFRTLIAEFQQTPAFVYFVIANAIAGAYNLLVILVVSFFKCKEYNIVLHLTDMVMMILVATGAAAATSMAELGKNGNVHAMWSPICDRFDAFCYRGGAALIASFIGALLLVILAGFSAVTLHKNVASHG